MMKKLIAIKAFILSISILASMTVFADEPQMNLINVKSDTQRTNKSEDLAQYEINGNELIQLYAIKTEKKSLKKINGALAKNTLNKSSISL
jgi:hypothetical protein